MKQNPCRYCALSTEIFGKHYSSHLEQCRDCENLKNHKEYLKAHRKFIEGEPITDLSELLEQEWVMWYHRRSILKFLNPCHLELFYSGLKLERLGKRLEKKVRKSKWQQNRK